MNRILKSIRITGVMLLICGILYPLLVTGIGQILFPYQANGSVIKVEGKEVGSELIGQKFNEETHFVTRLSSSVNYNMSEEKEVVDASSGSQNLGPTSEVLKERVEDDIKSFLAQNKDITKDEIPLEMITQSSSGLDPHITPKGAEIQVPRISKATGISEGELNKLIKENTEGKWLGLYGGERVNVLKLNISLDRLMK